jgi:hypothetical protein
MLSSRKWTLMDKWLIIAATVGSLFVASVLIYRYERDYRPSEKLFYGSWQGVSEDMSDGFYWQFRPDHTFSGFVLSPYNGEKLPFLEGRWYAGGPFLYLRVSHELGWPDPTVLRFDVSPHHLTMALPRSRASMWSLERVADSR